VAESESFVAGQIAEIEGSRLIGENIDAHESHLGSVGLGGESSVDIDNQCPGKDVGNDRYMLGSGRSS